MGELDLQGKIEFAYTPSGLIVAKEHVEALAAAANNAARETKPLGEGLKTTGQSAGIARNQVAAMTAVIFRSIGMSSEAGAAARVAATGFMVMSDAAQFANLKMAGITLGLSVLIPLVIEFASRNKQAAEAVTQVGKSADTELQSLLDYRDATKDTSRALEERIARLHDLAFAQQAVEVRENIERMDDLRKIGEQLFEQQKRLVRVRDNSVQIDKDAAKAIDSLKPRWEAAQLEIEALKARNEELNAAIRQGITLDMTRRTTLGLSTQATKEENKALDEKARLIKWLNDNRRRQEEQALDRQRKERDQEQDMQVRTAIFLRQQQQQREKDKRDQFADNAEKEANNKAYNASLRAEWGANVGAGLAAASALFGGNKAVAIAGAIADTYSAANKAIAIYGPTPLGYAAMATAIITGLANVANIRKTSAGFDDPVNDAIAVSFGRRFANDVVNLISVGFNQTLGQQARQTSASVAGGGGGMTINGGLHLGGFFGANETQLLKVLNRKLIMIQRLERRTSL